MNSQQAGASLDALISSFNSRIVELQELVIARNMYPATTVPDLAAVDTTLNTMESQIQSIKERLQEERNAIPKAKKVIERSQQQQKKLQHMLANMPSLMIESLSLSNQDMSSSVPDKLDCDLVYEPVKEKEDPVAMHKVKKGHSPAPRWYITSQELDSLKPYMRGRLTLEKVNIAINEIATYAETNAQLISCPKKKLSEETWEKALELRDISMAESVKGKHFFLESDVKGPGLKLDNTGKAILTVLRHLDRIQETRIGRHRVIILSKHQ